jgi:citrate lyase subunit beta / citryl-CoA lyase
MKESVAIAGNSGPKVRSDCEVILKLESSGNIQVGLTSKVKTLYGNSIISLVNDVLAFYGIKHASVTLNDSGALPFVISARLEAAVKSITNSDLEYLLPFKAGNDYSTTRNRFRFSRLYLPGNTPGLMINAGLHSADGIILDLEDSVAPEKKNEALILVRNALRQIDFYGAERMVRINQGERGLTELKYLIPHNVNLILVPKCEDPQYLVSVDEEINKIRESHGLKNAVYLMPIVETALGVENSYKIATACRSIVAIAIGLEDYTADLGVQRTLEGKESLYARSRLVVAAKAAGIQAIDSVFSDVADMESLKETVKVSKSLGFEGMGCIHPRQIAVIKANFAPDEAEIEKSKKILAAFSEAKKKGLGVVALGSKMIDPPVVARAERLIGLAISMKLLSPDWMTEQILSEK